MKLHNYTLTYLSAALLIIISSWAVIFYLNMLEEVYDSIDDGLDNYKLLIIQKVKSDSSTLHKTDFNESNYAIREISSKHARQLKDIYRDTLMYMQNEEDFEPVRILTTDFENNGRYYELRVISSMVEEDDLIADLFFALVWLYFILLAVIILVNTILLRKIWKPFYTLLNQLKTFRLGKDPIEQMTNSSVTEFRELNHAVVTLLQHNLESFNNQKQFTENAAHELQTPLAISINKLELLVEKNTLNETQADTIGQVIQLLERLTRLNKSLLLLSKIENKQFFENEKISVNALSRQLFEGFRDLADFRGIEIIYSEKDSLNTMMNRDLATVLLSNLIKNAITHTISNGRVEVCVNQNSFTVCNTATGKPLDPSKIFSRFYKGQSGQNGSGLGLAIVKAIAELYGFPINYTFNNEHCFEVKLNPIE